MVERMLVIDNVVTIDPDKVLEVSEDTISDVLTDALVTFHSLLVQNPESLEKHDLTVVDVERFRPALPR